MNTKKWFHKLPAVWVAVLTMMGSACVSANSSKPNIIFILADDMGYGDCTVNNPDSKIPTPHIDRLAKEGLRFTDAHSAAAVCTPSRYGLLTGTNPARTGVSNHTAAAGPVIAPGEVTIADLVRDQGYVTKMLGKWHLGFEMIREGNRPVFDFSRPFTGGPLDCGFDYFYGLYKAPNSAPYFYIKGRKPENMPTEHTDGNNAPGKDRRDIYRPGAIAPGFVPEEVTERLCRDAVRIIHEHAVSEKNKPLFLYYAMTSPHDPRMPTAEFIGKSGAGVYGDFVVQLDSEVGRVVKALEDTGLDNDTLVIFASDNGPIWREEDVQKYGHRAAGILSGSKASPYEGGHRVPFVAKWPGRIPASTVCRTTINFTDFFATLADMLNVNIEREYPRSAKDSYSFYPALFEPDRRFPRPPMVVGASSLRVYDWKLVARKAGMKWKEPEQSDVKIYNLADDLGEEHDLSDTNPERARALFKVYKDFLDSRVLKEDALAKTEKAKKKEPRRRPSEKDGSGANRKREDRSRNNRQKK